MWRNFIPIEFYFKITCAYNKTVLTQIFLFFREAFLDFVINNKCCNNFADTSMFLKNVVKLHNVISFNF